MSPTTTPTIELTSQVKSDPTEENSDQAKTPEQKPQADNKTPMCLINELVRFNKVIKTLLKKITFKKIYRVWF